MLAGTAELALLAAPDPATAATARFYLALAATDPDAASGDHRDPELVLAEEHLAEAVRLDPGRTPAWISQLAGLGAHRPAALRLIPLLAQALTPTPAPTPPGVEPHPGLPTDATASSPDRTVVLP